MQDQRFIATFTSSRLAASLSAVVDVMESAWRHSTARRAALVVAECLGSRRRGAATMTVAAVVTLGVQQLRATSDAALWILPVAVLIWAAGSLLWTAGARE